MDLEVGWVRVVDLEGRFGSIVTLLTVRYGRKSLYGDSYLDCFFFGAETLLSWRRVLCFAIGFT